MWPAVLGEVPRGEAQRGQRWSRERAGQGGHPRGGGEARPRRAAGRPPIHPWARTFSQREEQVWRDWPRTRPPRAPVPGSRPGVQLRPAPAWGWSHTENLTRIFVSSRN